MGNNAFIRVDSGENGFTMDFREKNNPSIEIKNPITNIRGTRFGIVLFDGIFGEIKRKEVDEFLDSELSKL